MAKRGTSRIRDHDAAPVPRNRGTILWCLVALAAVTGAVYSNSLSGAFVFDDRPHIFGNERTTTIFPLSTTLSGRRPIVDLTLAINRGVGGLDPVGYHLVNLVIHLLSGLTLFALLRQLGAGRAKTDVAHAGTPVGFPFAVALLWLVHPLQTQSVTYVIQRGESMMGLFYLLTLLTASRGMGGTSKRRWWLSASVVACALGMATKGVMVTAPCLVLLYDWVLVTHSLRDSLRIRWGYYLCMAGTLSTLVLCGVASGVLATSGRPHANVGFAVSGVSPTEYLFTQPGVLLHYLRLVVWPHPLCIDYGWDLVTRLSGCAIPGTLILVMLGASVWMCRRRPLAGFAGLSFFILLAPTSSIVPIRDPLFEHRMYLPLAAVLGLLVALLPLVTRKWLAQWPPTRTRAVSVLLLTLLTSLLGIRTVRRNADYHSEIAIWEQATEARPRNARAHYSLAVALGRAKRFPESQQAFRRAIEVSDERTRPDVLGEAHYHIGWSQIRQERPEEAIAAFRRALASNPDHVEATFELGFALAMLGRYEEADEALERTLALNPNHAQAKQALLDVRKLHAP